MNSSARRMQRFQRGQTMMQHRSLTGSMIEIRDFAEFKQDKQRRITAMRISQLSMASRRIVDDYPDLAGWFCLRVKDKQEFAVEKALADADVISLVLRHSAEIVVRRGRQWTLPERAWLSGYVLVRIVPSASAFAGLIALRSVVDVVGGMGKPFRIRDKIINEFSAMYGSLCEIRKSKLAEEGEFKEGQIVRVLDGPFASFEGIVTATVKKDADRVKCEVSIFGRSTPIELPLVSVEKL